jgi:hypothetical protein
MADEPLSDSRPPRDRRRDFHINSPYYERCDDPDCSDAYAFRAPFPEVVHYHYIGPRDSPEPTP